MQLCTMIIHPTGRPVGIPSRWANESKRGQHSRESIFEAPRGSGILRLRRSLTPAKQREVALVMTGPLGARHLAGDGRRVANKD
jgi:hypothetical protein